MKSAFLVVSIAVATAAMGRAPARLRCGPGVFRPLAQHIRYRNDPAQLDERLACAERRRQIAIAA